MAEMIAERVHVRAGEMIRMIVVVMVMMVVSEMIGMRRTVMAAVDVVKLLIAVLAFEVEKVRRTSIIERAEIFERLQIGAGRIGRIVRGRSNGGRRIATAIWMIARIADAANSRLRVVIRVETAVQVVIVLEISAVVLQAQVGIIENEIFLLMKIDRELMMRWMGLVHELLVSRGLPMVGQLLQPIRTCRLPPETQVVRVAVGLTN